MFSSKKIEKLLESELSDTFQIKLVAKSSTWVHGGPFYTYVNKSNIPLNKTI